MDDKQSSLYLVSGVIIGILLGLLYSIVIDPVTLIDNSPAALNEKSKASFRILAASAYQQNGDLGRARHRIELLSEDNPISMLSIQAQTLLAAQGDADTARSLALLASDLENGVSSIQNVTNGGSIVSQEQSAQDQSSTQGSSADELETPDPEITFTPRATRTAIPTLSSPFQMEYREIVCEKDLPEGLLQVEVLDNNGNPVPGIKIEVTWQDGNDYFYTGLYPEINPGYADFIMQTEHVYSLRIENSSDVVEAIEAPLCDGGKDEDFYGGWWYRFIQ